MACSFGEHEGRRVRLKMLIAELQALKVLENLFLLFLLSISAQFKMCVSSLGDDIDHVVRIASW